MNTAPPPRKSGDDYRCVDCRHRLAKSNVSEGLVLTGLKCLVVTGSSVTGQCTKCGAAHAIGGFFLAYRPQDGKTAH